MPDKEAESCSLSRFSTAILPMLPTVVDPLHTTSRWSDASADVYCPARRVQEHEMSLDLFYENREARESRRASVFDGWEARDENSRRGGRKP